MNRSEILCDAPSKENTLYLMRRDQRIVENHCIELAYEFSAKNIYVMYDYGSIVKNNKQTKFILQGMSEVLKQANDLNLYFTINFAEDSDQLAVKDFIKKNKIDSIIVDFCPLRQSLEYVKKLTKYCNTNKIRLIRCDSHNMVPCFKLTQYKRTGKSVKADLYKHWSEYYKAFKELKEYKFNKNVEKFNKETEQNFNKYFEKFNEESLGAGKKGKKLKIGMESGKGKEKSSIDYHTGGYSNGMKELSIFFEERFSEYDAFRNNPDKDVLSNLSPWIHCGQISSLKVIQLAMKRFSPSNVNLDTFLNEVFVWKETADHFCYHEKNYDNLEGALPWAKETLTVHKKDKRAKIYTLSELENGLTSDEYWNAGQKQMVITGKMHGYVRMYWAKTLLQWSKTPEEALERAFYLNDKYSIDGNDPNGYLGIMWSICGSMDQGWAEREIIGKIRAMKPCKTKKYVNNWADKNIEDYIY